jgi:hypothetical protein
MQSSFLYTWKCILLLGAVGSFTARWVAFWLYSNQLATFMLNSYTVISHLAPSSKRAIHYVMEALNRGSLFTSQTVYAVTQLSGLVTNVRRCNVCMHTHVVERQRRLAVYRSFITRLIKTPHGMQHKCSKTIRHTHTCHYKQKYLYIC